MTSRSELPILIAGGGIGGLAAALSIAKTGICVHALEPCYDELQWRYGGTGHDAPY